MTIPASKRIALALSNIIIPIAVLVFATGFFPYKPFLSGLATFEEVENEELGLGFLKGNDRPQRIFDKVIFMTVDALRRWVRSPRERHDQRRIADNLPVILYTAMDQASLLHKTLSVQAPHCPSQHTLLRRPSPCLESRL